MDHWVAVSVGVVMIVDPRHSIDSRFEVAAVAAVRGRSTISTWMSTIC